MQRTVPALDEAMQVLNEFSKDLDEGSLAEAVAQELEAICVQVCNSHGMYLHLHMLT